MGCFSSFSTKENFPHPSFSFIPSVTIILHNVLFPNMLSFCVIILISCCDTELKWTRSSPTESVSSHSLFIQKGGGERLWCRQPTESSATGLAGQEVRWELAEQLCPWNIWVKYTRTLLNQKSQTDQIAGMTGSALVYCTQKKWAVEVID